MVCISVTNPCRASTQAFRSKVEFQTRWWWGGGHFRFLRLTVSQGYCLSLHLSTTCALKGRLLLVSKVFCDFRPSDIIQFILHLNGSQGGSVPAFALDGQKPKGFHTQPLCYCLPIRKSLENSDKSDCFWSFVIGNRVHLIC